MTTTTETVTVRRGWMNTLNAKGDTGITWDPGNTTEVEAAREHFDRMRDVGYLAYTVDESGDRGEVVRDFDPDAARIVLSPPLAGG